VSWQVSRGIVANFCNFHRNKESKSIIRQSNFDGFYNYNASNGANYFSTWKNWEKLKKFAEMYNLIFVPTVGPGESSSLSSA
jgi:hypothetical protein